ncbi:Uncharacterised protein [Klebsiella pneumoniae]|nr:Uncharacterised protein [Klebsiella pneumoniae]
MPGMAQGAHRGRPVAAAPCTPGLRPAKSPLRGAFDLSLQASGRAEAASVQNTALSPHPCGLPRPSGNVSAILRPPAPAVSATMVNKLTTSRTDRRPGKSQPPPGTKAAPHPLPLPGGATLARACEGRELSAKSPGRVRRSCHPAKIRHQSVARIRRHTPPSGFFSAGAVMPLTRLSEASRCCKCTNAIPEFHVCCVPKVEVGDYLHIEKWLPKPWRFIQRFLCLHKNPFPWF